MCAQLSSIRPSNARRAVAPDPATAILFEGPVAPGDDLEFDYDFVDGAGGAGKRLLPDSFAWRNETAKRTRVPLALCEFLAYKAALAYQDEAEIRAQLGNYPGVTNIIVFDEKGGGLTDTQGFAFVYQNRGYIVMRGTKGNVDWKTANLADSLTNALLAEGRAAARLKSKYAAIFTDDGPPEPDCHLGFLTGWRAVRPKIDGWLADLRAGPNPPSSFVFSGHSLGGALAILGAYDFATQKLDRRDVAAVVTFGAPCVGTSKFAERYDKLLGPRSIRVEAKGDAVPDVMGRFYYLVIWYARQMVLTMSLPAEPGSYRKSGVAYDFSAQPLLTRDAFLETVRAAEARAKKQAEADKKSAEKTASKPTTPTTTAPSPTAAPSGHSPAPTPGAQGDANSKVAIIVIGGVFIAVAALVLYLFALSKVKSHAVLNRYALYFSTLSYQRLRALHAGRLDLANAALGDHLRAMHRDYDLDKTIDAKIAATPFYDAVKTGPFLLDAGDAEALAKFLGDRKGVEIC